MSYFEFPHTRTYDSDLGWLIKAVEELKEKLNNYIDLNSIKFADPINWNITSQYEANTVVLDSMGNGFISRKPVPAGVALNDTEYWVQVAAFGTMVEQLRHQIARADEESSTTATAERNVEDLVWLNGVLFRCVRVIHVGDTYVDGENVEDVTIEGLLREAFNRISSVNAALDNKINIVNADGIILIGDSYGVSPVPSESWIKYMKDALGDNVYSNAYGGASFGGRGRAYGAWTFTEVLQELEGTVGDPLKIKKIVVAGGFNDYEYFGSTTNDGIRDLSEYVEDVYPNAMIHIAFIPLYDNHWAVYTPEGVFDHWDDTDKESILVTGVLSAYKKAAANFKNVSFIEDSEYIFRNYYYVRENRAAEGGAVVPGDGLHPSANGSREIARGLLGFLKSGICIQENHASVASVFNASGKNTLGTLTLYETPCKEYIHILGTAFPTIDNANFSDLGGVELFNCIDDIQLPRFVRGLSGTFATVPCEYRIVDSLGAYASRNGRLIFKMGKVYLESFHNEVVNGLITLTVSANIPTLYA